MPWFMIGMSTMMARGLRLSSTSLGTPFDVSDADCVFAAAPRPPSLICWRGKNKKMAQAAIVRLTSSTKSSLHFTTLVSP
jgi:hypothetical protein